MAAVLWSFVAEQDHRAKLDAATYFFEATARYLGVLLLSGLRSDRDIYLESRPSWQGVGALPSVMMRRSTMGSWARLDADMSKAVRRRLHVDAGRTAALFGLEAPDPIRAITSKPVGEILAEGVRRRNEWRGHDAGISAGERRQRVDAMRDLIAALRTALEGGLDDWDLLKPRSLQATAGRFIVDTHVLDGPNPRMRSKSLTLVHPVRTDSLYVSIAGSNRALELVPLMRALQPDSAAESAVYFFDRLDRNEARWLSYDSEAQPEFREDAPESLLGLLADLDEPTEGSGRAPSAAPDAANSVQGAPSRLTTSPAPELRSFEGSIDRFIVGSIARVDPGAKAQVERGRTSLLLDRRIGWLQPRGSTWRLTVNAPIERAPQVPDLLLIEIPVSEDDLPAIELVIEEREDAYGAIAALAVAMGIVREWDLAGTRLQEAYRLGAQLPDAAPVRVGNGTWPPCELGPRAQTAAWEALAQRLTADHAWGGRRIARWPGMLRAFWSDGIDVSVRLDATSTYVAVELSEPLTSTALDHVAARRDEARRIVGAGLIWQRRMESLLILQHVGGVIDGSPSSSQIDDVARHLMTLGTGVKGLLPV